MRRVVYALLLPPLLALTSCSGGSSEKQGQYVGDSITRTDFENLAGWGADASALTNVHAHSGNWATYAGPGREYSLTFKLPLGRASVHPIKALDVSAWVYLPSAQPGAVLVAQVFAPDGSKALYYNEVRLNELTHDYAHWQPVQHIFELPAGLPMDAELRLFVWGKDSTEPVYLDDLTVKARE